MSLMHTKYLKGFNLIELMITLAIIGILVAVGVPYYGSQLKKGRISTGEGDLSALALQLVSYKTSGYNGLVAEDIYTPESKSFKLTIVPVNSGRSYLLRADGIAGTEGEDDGTLWFNPTGKNCYFSSGGDYDAACSGGEEWN